MWIVGHDKFCSQELGFEALDSDFESMRLEVLGARGIMAEHKIHEFSPKGTHALIVTQCLRIRPGVWALCLGSRA